MKNLSKAGKLTKEQIDKIMSEEKPNQIPTMKFNEDRMLNVLPLDLEIEDIEDYVVKSVEHYRSFEAKVKKELSNNLVEKDVNNFLIRAIRHYSTIYKQKKLNKGDVR